MIEKTARVGSYTDSDVDIHSSVVSHAQEFAQGQSIEDSYFVRKGIGRSEWGAKYGENSRPKERAASDGVIRWLFGASVYTY